MNLYSKIKVFCEEKGLTVRDLERRAGLGNGTIGGWRTSSPRIATVSKVAEALGVTINDLTSDNR